MLGIGRRICRLNFMLPNSRLNVSLTINNKGAFGGDRAMKSIALSLLIGSALGLSGCSVERDLSMVRPLTYHDIQAHNNWAYLKNNEAKATPFKGRPIQVSGIGRVKAVPNIAVITGQIKTEASTDDAAVDLPRNLSMTRKDG